jgi:uncharacterized protein YhaN
MKVRDIQIDGFGVWSGLSVDSLPEGMTVFYGPNEAGKTTLMQFLRTMLYGFTADRRQRYLPPVFGGKPGGAMRVTGPGGGYEIARRATLNDPSIVGQLTVTSSDGVTQGQHRLTSLLGSVDESIFTNVFAIGLRELQELSTLDDTAAADELYKLSSGLDRVSLVDVMRQLKGARSQVVSTEADQGQMALMLQRREKLRDEIEQLTVRGRRWGELAAHRRNQQNEIEELKLRVGQWELESKTVETAIQIREPWQSREATRTKLKSLNARVDLPDNSYDRLEEIQREIEEKREQVQAIREERKALRERATNLPVSKGILTLAGKIEAANEQGPWITSLQLQIQRLESECEQSQEQLLEDAKRLGLTEQDQEALLNDKRLANLPDLSRQAISQLAGPARDVRTYQTRLKQAKEQGLNDKKEASRLAAEIEGFLSVQGESDLQTAHKNAHDLLSNLRKVQQLDERIEKYRRHRKEIEDQAVDLESEEVFPIDDARRLLLPFVGGSMMLVLGLGKFLGWNMLRASRAAVNATAQVPAQSEQTIGFLLVLVGIGLLCYTFFLWKSLEQDSKEELDNCDSQLDAVDSQLRKTIQERDELLESLPEHTGTLEQRIRDAESDLVQCENYLPTLHNLQAAEQRYETAKQHAKEAMHGLKSARSSWKKVLMQLGMAESLSPKSIRILAEGYESLTQTRRRLKAQQDELAQRKIELSTAMQRIEALSLQLKVAIEESNNAIKEATRSNWIDPNESRRDGNRNQSDSRREDRRDERRDRDRDRREQRQRDEQVSLRAAAAAAAPETTEGPLLKLQELTNTLAQHKQYIVLRKELKSQDEELARKQKIAMRGMEKWIRTRQSHLADLGVEDAEQLQQHLQIKSEYLRLENEVEQLDHRIRSAIGGNVPYETVMRMLENTPGHELEKRWETLGQRITQAEERIAVLLQRQGETSQEMKSLAADRRIAEAKLELASLEKQISACADHWRTLGATTCMLEKVCEVYETERQPETLREASAFLKQLTDGKYVRVWTPLGKNALRIDNDKNQSLPLEVLSRGTREAVFIALRLSLAAAYSRRGVTLPLVLDDVLVNFDSIRANFAAKVLRDFAALGHQVIMFTCHEHIMRIFHNIDVQVRVLPAQGQSGEAKVYQPHDVPVEPKKRVKAEVVETPELVVKKPVVVEVPAEVVLVPKVDLPPVVLPPAPALAAPVEEPAVPKVELPPEETVVPVEPLVVKPKRQRVPAMELVGEGDQDMPFAMWYEEESAGTGESDPAERLWNELDRMDLPFEGEPHDLWWSEAK